MYNPVRKQLIFYDSSCDVVSLVCFSPSRIAGINEI